MSGPEGAAEVRLHVAGPVAEIVLTADRRRNALTVGMAHELSEALRRVAEDPSVGVLVVRSAGGFFCAGADLGAIASAGSDPAEAEAFDGFDAIYRTFAQLAAMPVPTIAAVRGGAVGAGLNLALSADVRVVAEDARLLSGFLRIGVHPGGGHFQLVARLVGPERAAAMSLLGLEVRGADAPGCGLALRAVPDGDVDGAAHELAARVVDPALSRRATSSWRANRATVEPAPDLLIRAEQAAQMWSFRRRGSGG
ncbi:MAG: enoyl-CoA hydratase/isomerase family protein [Solirubrobacteraceae bacterium]